MYKIGEFSKITNLTVKALRYYDEEKILQPSSRGDNDYRLYDKKDFEKAQLIVILRKFNFSIVEIKDVLVNYKGDDDFQYYLAEKKALISKNIKKEKALMKEIDSYITPKTKKERNSMNYKIEVKDFAPVRVVSTRYKGAYSDVGKYIGKLYKVAKSHADGAPFNCYFDVEYKEIADIELCVPIKNNVQSTEVTVKQLPRIRAISTIHTGSYESINLAYKALTDYAQQNNLECELPSREIYLKGPGMVLKGNPENYITEIAIPIKQKVN